MTAAAWHPDPSGRHELRYWDGSRWTEHVSDAGAQSVSPLEAPGSSDSGASAGADTGSDAGSSASSSGSDGGADAYSAATQVRPSAGRDEVPTEPQLRAEPEPQPEPAHQPQAQVAAQPAYQPQAQAYGGAPAGGAPAGGPPAHAFAGISGDLVDGRFAEGGGQGATNQNPKMLRVRVGEPFMARQGSMVGYQGNVEFAFQGGGAAKFLKKAITGEGLSLMRVEGAGDVFLADQAHDVHVLHLQNSGISVNGSSVLAFSASLSYDIERVKGGSIAAGGLFNTALRGTGWVAVTTDGAPVVLSTAEAPTFADTNAVVAWSIDLQTSLKTSFSAGALIGRGSGEALQVAFQGAGFVIIQPSEGQQVPPHTH